MPAFRSARRVVNIAASGGVANSLARSPRICPSPSSADSSESASRRFTTGRNVSTRRRRSSRASSRGEFLASSDYHRRGGPLEFRASVDPRAQRGHSTGDRADQRLRTTAQGRDRSFLAPGGDHGGRPARRLPRRSQLMFPQLPAAVRVFLCTRPTDLRKSFDGLTGLVQECFGQDPLTGHLFLFLNRRRDRIKILYFDRDGLGDLVQTTRGWILPIAPCGCPGWRRTPAGATGHAPLGDRPAHRTPTQAIPTRRLRRKIG